MAGSRADNREVPSLPLRAHTAWRCTDPTVGMRALPPIRGAQWLRILVTGLQAIIVASGFRNSSDNARMQSPHMNPKIYEMRLNTQAPETTAWSPKIPFKDHESFT